MESISNLTWVIYICNRSSMIFMEDWFDPDINFVNKWVTPQTLFTNVTSCNSTLMFVPRGMIRYEQFACISLLLCGPLFVSAILQQFQLLPTHIAHMWIRFGKKLWKAKATPWLWKWNSPFLLCNGVWWASSFLNDFGQTIRIDKDHKRIFDDQSNISMN